MEYGLWTGSRNEGFEVMYSYWLGQFSLFYFVSHRVTVQVLSIQIIEATTSEIMSTRYRPE